MRHAAVWAIRDARDLDADAKSFLFVVETRGVMFSEWQTAAADMGLSKSAYYRTRRRLLDAELVSAQRRVDGTTAYAVNVEALREYVPEPVCV